MKKILFFLSFCIISLCIIAEEKKVITDADIFSVYTGETDEEPTLHAYRVKLYDTSFDPYVSVADARKKAEKNSKCTITATNSEITIRFVTAAVQSCEFYSDSHKSNYGNPQRPDGTDCKHGNHKMEVVMVLGDGSTYSGRADYDCSYSGYQVPRTHKKSGRNAAGQSVTEYGFGSSADPFAPWYVEHTITQHINLASFANSAKISTNELVKRILYYGITSFKKREHHYDWGDGGIRKALFVGTGYKAKWDALEKKETSLGMADWNAAKSEMKKTKPDFEKASRLFVSGSKHLKKAHQFKYEKIHEINMLFKNFTAPMFNKEAYDPSYMSTIVQAYVKTMESVEDPEAYPRPSNKKIPALIAKLWLNMRDYNPEFFKTYNQLYEMPDMGDVIKKNLKIHHDEFKKNMFQYATDNPERFNQTLANYMDNPLMGDSCIDVLIVAKEKAESVLAKENFKKGEFDILHLFRHAPDSAMWHRSYSLSTKKSTREPFLQYYNVLVDDIGQIMDTLCNMVIQGKADIVSEICHSQFDPIMGSQGDKYQDRSELFNYYYNLYDQVSRFTKELEYCADNNDKARAKELLGLAHNKFGINERQQEEDYRMGHADSLMFKTQAEREAIRSLLRNVRFQAYYCKRLTNFDPKKDLFIIAETGNQPLENPNFELNFSKPGCSITEVYVDGQLINIKPKKSKSKYYCTLMYTYPGILNPINDNSFHCFIFKGKKAIQKLRYVPFNCNNVTPSIYYWIEAPNIESELTMAWNKEVKNQIFLTFVLNE